MVDSIEQQALRAKQMAAELAILHAEKKQAALLAMAKQLSHSSDGIMKANAQDLRDAKQKNKPAAFVDRMTLTESGIDAMITGIQQIAALPDPVGRVLKKWDVPSGLHFKRVSIPIGVIAIMYESRPNVTADAAALCLKSGNAVILRGGSDCLRSNQQIVKALQVGLSNVGLDTDMIQYVADQDRAAVDTLLSLDECIDVIIPRGGKSLIERIRANSRIPVFSHLDGLCHTYIHADADFQMALEVVLNAKLRRTGICGATETLLVDAAVAESILPPLIEKLNEQGCEVRGDKVTLAIDPRVLPATEGDWSTEYLDAILAIKVVSGIEEAIAHIARFGSDHTDSIITQNQEAADRFQAKVGSSIVMHNCSTQFADGGEFGMGAEIGIATGKLHARGPVGVEELTTYKTLVCGEGQIRPK